jgi:hypothetical protein
MSAQSKTFDGKVSRTICVWETKTRRMAWHHPSLKPTFWIPFQPWPLFVQAIFVARQCLIGIPRRFTSTPKNIFESKAFNEEMDESKKGPQNKNKLHGK